MNLEQITFRVDIEEGHHSAFVHLIGNGEGCFSVKIGDLVMSIDEFREYVRQLAKIETRLKMIEEFARNVES